MSNQEQIDTKSRKLLDSRADMFCADADIRQASAADAGQYSIKAPFIANGGAILALLTFIGNTNAIVDKTLIWWSFVCFGTGFVSVMIAHWTHYKSLGSFTVHARYTATQLYNPENAEQFNDRRDESESKGKRFRSATIGLLAISVLSFVAGSFAALNAIT